MRNGVTITNIHSSRWRQIGRKGQLNKTVNTNEHRAHGAIGLDDGDDLPSICWSGVVPWVFLARTAHRLKWQLLNYVCLSTRPLVLLTTGHTIPYHSGPRSHHANNFRLDDVFALLPTPVPHHGPLIRRGDAVRRILIVQGGNISAMATAAWSNYPRNSDASRVSRQLGSVRLSAGYRCPIIASLTGRIDPSFSSVISTAETRVRHLWRT